MDRRIKIGLIILGSVAVAGGISYLIYRQVKKAKKQQADIEAVSYTHLRAHET